MAEHDEQSSIVKTPQRLITIVVLAFVVTVFGIVMLVQLVVDRPHADPAALSPEAVSARIQPVGKIDFGAAGNGAGVARSGEEVTKAMCGACHLTGAAGAPKTGDKTAWAPRLKGGLEGMLANAIKGIKAMPPRGGLEADAAGDLELPRAIVYMANQSGGSLKEPAEPKK